MSDNDHTGFGGLDQDEYDALAELFLGDSTFAPPRRAPVRGTGPEATETESKPESPQITRETPPVLADARGLPRKRPPSLGPVSVELVILGHLPVRAGLWLKEYAASVSAEDRAPVALLRLAPDIASVDLLGSGGFEPHGPAPTFSDAVRRARIDASRFVLRVNETAEPALAENRAVDRVTILTGADEAALVASYRLVKSLAAAWDRQFDMDEGPTLRLAVMGSSDANARAAAAKLQSAAESFLQRRVEIQICSGKIGATASAPSSSIFRGEANESVGELLGLIRPNQAAPATGPEQDQGPDETHDDLHEHRQETETELRLVGGHADATEEDLETGFGSEPADERSPEIVIRRAPVRPASTGEAGVNGVEASPEPGDTEAAFAGVDRGTDSGRVGPTAPTQSRQPRIRRATSRTLASRLEGLTAIETVCPFTPRVEFAAAADGSLHLITECEIQRTSASNAGNHVGAGVERLVAASAWARAHLSLLLRAEPLLAMPSADRSDDDGPVLHLLTGDARAARGLLDSDVFVHLTRGVKVGDETVWVTDDLN